MFVDQLGRSVRIDQKPVRIVSLVPSQTELLHALGLEDEVVGITKFCIYPQQWFQNKERIGGTKNLNIELIRSLNPDLIIGNKEENTFDDISILEKEFPVWMSDVNSLEDADDMILKLGEIVGKLELAQELKKNIHTAFQQLDNSVSPKKVLYYIWSEPDFVVGGNTFIDAIIKRIGWENVVKETRYPECHPRYIEEADCLLLSSEPFPFKEKHKEEFEKLYPNKEIILVNGEYFSWYGSRLLDAPIYFSTLIG
ncbi:MAG: ABC transporter substrate-binding protein [Bacteroidetes bacterium]|nr:ABC transporter substrate-binding protein [Bacteroidota bacterium]